MATVGAQPSIRSYILNHLLESLRRTPTHDAPFSHFYVENVFPDDIYEQLLDLLPDPSLYRPLSINKHFDQTGKSTRDVLPLTEADRLAPMPAEQREFWQAICAALTSPEVKSLVFQKLATDLSARFGVRREEVDRVESFCKPSLLRDLDSYEIVPHPDGRAKIVTMQLYLPRDRSQLELGTALYRRRLHWLKGIYSWQGRFEKVKQFSFQPNSGYAFAVSNAWNKKSWHGREALPSGSGTRNTLMNLYFASDDRTY